MCINDRGEALSVVAYGATAPWVPDCVRHIEGLRDLTANWNSYGAKPIDARSIELAKEVVAGLARCVGIGAPRIGASPNGHVALTWEWERKTRELDVEILPNGTLKFAHLDERNPAADEEGETTDLTRFALLLTN